MGFDEGGRAELSDQSDYARSTLRVSSEIFTNSAKAGEKVFDWDRGGQVDEWTRTFRDRPQLVGKDFDQIKPLST